MRLKRHLRTAALALISGASLAAAFYAVGLETILSALTGIRLGPVLLAGVLVLANAVFALLRFRFVLRVFGYRPGWRQIVFAFTIGQVSNQVLFNVIGQSLSRAAALNSAGVPFSVSVMATYWERLIAAGLLFVLSIVSAFFLFLSVRIDIQAGGGYLLSLCAGMALVSLAVGVTVLRSREIDINFAAAPRFLLKLWPSFALTLAAHAAMLGAYAVALTGLQLPSINLNITAALTIVMFAASLPISFSGWGIRELSAAQALSAVGVDPTVAVAGAVVVGLLALLVTMVGAAIGLYLYFQLKTVAPAPAEQNVPVAAQQRWTSIAVLGATILTAMLLFFQIRLPLEQGEITANAADVLALTGLGLLMFYLWTKRSLGPVPGWFFFSMAAVSLLVLLGLGLGYFNFGSNSWALMNRGLGWIIILGYVALGASAAALTQPGAIRLVLGVFAISGTCVAALQLILMMAIILGLNLPSNAFPIPLSGYAINSNAFAFQMVMAAACIVTAGRIRLFNLGQASYNVALVLTSLSIYYALSRSGLGMLGILLVLMVIFSPPGRRREAIVSVAAVCAALLAAYLGPYILPPVLSLLASALSALRAFFDADTATTTSTNNLYLLNQLSITIARTSSDSERWLSIVEGWNLWLQHPVFGAGLGGYVQERLSAGREFLVVHSIPVWLLAEMGLVGLFVVAVVLILLVNNAFQLLAQPNRHGWGLGLLIIVACMTAAGLVHDFFFQRSFWFLLGLYVAAGFSAQPDDGRSAAA